MATLPLSKNDYDFWIRIMTEHCQFLYLSLEDDDLKSQAFDLWKEWEEVQVDTVTELLEQLRDFKQTVKSEALNRWIGWISVSFVEHILEELEYFSTLLSGQKVSHGEVIDKALDWIHDHASSASTLLDPSEEKWVQVMQKIAKDTKSVPDDEEEFLIGLTLRHEDELSRALKRIRDQNIKRTIHPLLLDHWLREGAKMKEVLTQR